MSHTFCMDNTVSLPIFLTSFPSNIPNVAGILITTEIQSCTSGYKIDCRLNSILEQSITCTKLNYSTYRSVFLFNYNSLVVKCLCTRKRNKSGPRKVP